MIPITKNTLNVCAVFFKPSALSSILNKILNLIILLKEDSWLSSESCVQMGLSISEHTYSLFEIINDYNYNKFYVSFVLMLDSNKVFHRVTYCGHLNILFIRDMSFLVPILLIIYIILYLYESNTENSVVPDTNYYVMVSSKVGVCLPFY